MSTLKEMVIAKNIKMTCEYGAKYNEEFENSDPWTCILKNGRKQMTVAFYMGKALCREPELDEVIDCLLSDASLYENSRDFEDFSAELGYDSDSRKAEKIYKACGIEANKLKKFLGDDYETFMYADRD